jgi:hypothetical protein
MLIIVIFFFFFFASYSRPPIGDDILYQFKSSSSHYNDSNTPIGEKITTLGMAFSESIDKYFNWGGRIVGHFFGSVQYISHILRA